MQEQITTDGPPPGGVVVMEENSSNSNHARENGAQQPNTAEASPSDLPFVVSLESEKRTFAPGDDVWVIVSIRNNGTNNPPTPSKARLTRGSVVLVGEERTGIVKQGRLMEGNVAIFEPVIVYLEGSTIPRWRVCLKLPNDVPPSCELGAVPPNGSVIYVITARLSIGKNSASASNRIRVVSSRAMLKTKPADAEGAVLDKAPMCTMPCFPAIFTSSPDAPEWRVMITSKCSFRPGEHIKYRTTIRGNGPRGSSSKFNRIDGLRVSIRRSRWFSDGHGHDVSPVSDFVKPPQLVDFSASAAGSLPIDFQGEFCFVWDYRCKPNMFPSQDRLQFLWVLLQPREGVF